MLAQRAGNLDLMGLFYFDLLDPKKRKLNATHMPSKCLFISITIQRQIPDECRLSLAEETLTFRGI